MKKYCILGTDRRNLELKKMYEEKGYFFTDYNLADVIVTPIPFSRDDVKINGDDIIVDNLISALSNTNKVMYSGAISKNIKEKLEKANVKYYDILDFESFAVLNAIPTAEGAIQRAMELTNFTIHDSNILVMGYGRIGKILSKMLSGIGAKVFCEARKEKDIAIIKSMGYNSIRIGDIDNILPKIDIIFNTIPVVLLDESKIKLLNKNCIVIDLASKPGGIDLDVAKEYGINVSVDLGLPSIVAPYTAAKYLMEEIERLENT